MLNVVVALIAALPFGWGLGLLAAHIVGGPQFGQLPAFTIPVCVLASLAFAVLPIGASAMRRNILIGGAAGFILLGAIVA